MCDHSMSSLRDELAATKANLADTLRREATVSCLVNIIYFKFQYFKSFCNILFLKFVSDQDVYSQFGSVLYVNLYSCYSFVVSDPLWLVC